MRPTRNELAADIRRYCATHPNALDTVEGIAWWVAIQRYGDMLDDVRAVVDSLVSEGVLVRYLNEDGGCVFGCRPRENEPNP